MRQLIAALSASVWLFAAGIACAEDLPADEVNLRTTVIVDGNYITLGDVFDNAGDNAGKNIAYAPAPGRRISLDGKWLYRLAQAYHLPWRPFSLNVHAVVERASQVVQQDQVHDALIEAIKARGVTGDITIEFYNNTSNMRVATDKDLTIGVESLSFDQGSGRFSR